MVGLLALPHFRAPGVHTSPSVSRGVIPPAPGGFERRILDDGSVVELNRGAEIEVNFSASVRRVSLRHGEALFTVHKDADRPFVVQARGVDVRAVGTAFNVRLDSNSVEVLVTEGRVQLAPPRPAGSASTLAPAAPPLVVAGQHAVVSLAAPAMPNITRTSAAQLARLQAWQPQLLDFSSTPLVEVIAEFNARNRMQLVLEEPTFASVPIVASIRSDNFDGFVRLLAASTKLRAERRGDYQIVLRAAN
jgi:transmembrane sensor